MKDQHDRREFLAKSIRWSAAAGLLGALEPSALAQTAVKPITRTLGKTGITLPVVCMGVMNADVPGIVRRSYEVGIRHFDSAYVYQQGRNEEMVGNVIKELGVRDKVIISTKIRVREKQPNAAALTAAMRAMAETSLKRLQMDYLDILYIHGPDIEGMKDEGNLNALTSLKKEGKVRFIGVSNHMLQGATATEAVRLGVYDVLLLGFNYTMASDTALIDALRRAHQAGIGMVAMKTQAGGAARPDPKLPKATPASQTALLKWVLRQDFIDIAIPGYTAYDQLDQNWSVVKDLTLTAEESSFLGDKATMAAAEFCQQCSECRADCPSRADIPAMMRAHMYAVQYGNHDMAADTLASIDAGKGLDACDKCETCSASCRNTVNIARKIGVLKQLPVLA